MVLPAEDANYKVCATKVVPTRSIGRNTQAKTPLPQERLFPQEGCSYKKGCSTRKVVPTERIEYGDG